MKTLQKLSVPFLLLSGGICLTAVGIVANAFFGLTGLIEVGQGKHSECLLPHTHAIYLEEVQAASRRVQYIALKEGNLHIPSSSSLQITMTQLIPHAEERMKCLLNGKATIQCPGGLASDLVLQPARFFRPSHANVNGQKWRLGAVKTNEIGVTAAELSCNRPPKSSSFVLIEDDAQSEYLLMIGSEGEMALSSLSSYFKDKLVALNEGEKGYAIEIAIPKSFVDTQLPSPFYVKVFSAPKVLKPSENKKNNNPCVFLQFSEEGRAESLPLVYDPTASSVRWPVCNGKYLVRYQPQTHPLPFILESAKWNCSHAPNEQHTKQCSISLLVDGKTGPSVNFQSTSPLKKRYRARLSAFDDKRTFLQLDQASLLKVLIYPGVFLIALSAFLMQRQRKKRS